MQSEEERKRMLTAWRSISKGSYIQQVSQQISRKISRSTNLIVLFS